MNHLWDWESGKTRTCSRCRTVRYSLDARGEFTANSNAVRYEYKLGGAGPYLKQEPACEPMKAAA